MKKLLPLVMLLLVPLLVGGLFGWMMFIRPQPSATLANQPPTVSGVPTLAAPAVVYFVPTPTLAVPPTEPPIATATGLPLSFQTPLPPTATPTVALWLPLPPLATEWQGLITHGDRTLPFIALTFDLCESLVAPAGFDSEIVRILNDSQTPATFFVGGVWMVNHTTEILTLAYNPLFELGSHSWSHADFSKISPAEMDDEILQSQQTMWTMLGRQPVIFRLPYGTYNEETLDIIANHGLITIQWDVVSGDPDPNISAEAMIPWVIQQVQPGSIIIMHANGRGWHTAEALPTIIQTLRDQGYTFVTISQLLGLPTN